MKLLPGNEEEYEKRHTPIWPELAEALKAHGAHNYSIYLNPETLQLFAYVEIENEERWNAIAQTEICQLWWKHMSDLMETHEDGSPVAHPLPEVFHLD